MWLYIISAFCAFIEIPNYIIEKDEEYEELATRERKREEWKNALNQSGESVRSRSLFDENSD